MEALVKLLNKIVNIVTAFLVLWLVIGGIILIGGCEHFGWMHSSCQKAPVQEEVLEKAPWLVGKCQYSPWEAGWKTDPDCK